MSIDRIEEYRDFTVIERVEEAEGVISIRFADPSGQPIPEWLPGAHVDVMLGNDMVRQYSLCNQAGDTSHYRIAVLRAGQLVAQLPAAAPGASPTRPATPSTRRSSPGMLSKLLAGSSKYIVLTTRR